MPYIIDDANFDVRNLVGGIIASYPFIVSGIRYSCWFTELTVDLESVEDTVREIEEDGIYNPENNTFKVDFDLESNFITYDEDELLKIPEGGYGNSIRDMRDITSAICEIIQIHQQIYDCIFYLAEPATEGHENLYRRNMIPLLMDSGYSYHILNENAEEINTYIFIKNVGDEVNEY